MCFFCVKSQNFLKEVILDHHGKRMVAWILHQVQHNPTFVRQQLNRFHHISKVTILRVILEVDHKEDGFAVELDHQEVLHDKQV